MTADQFAYWLQGFTELHGEPPTPAQWQMIKDHLGLVFDKVTPRYPPQFVPLSPMPMTPGLPSFDKWTMPPRIECAAGSADTSIRTYC